MKPTGDAGLPALAQGWNTWLAAGTGPDVVSYRLNDELWFGRFRLMQLQNLSLVLAAFAPAADFRTRSDWDASNLGMLALAAIALACLLAGRILRRVDGT